MRQLTAFRPVRSALGALVLTTAMVVSMTSVTTAATTDPNPSAREIANAAVSRHAATEGMVLFENDGALPMPASGNVAVFGVGAYKTVKGGTGSGDVNSRYTINVRQGFESAGFTVTTSSAYWDAVVAGGEQPLTPATAQPSAPTDTAVFVLARNSGEGSDRSATAGDYYLTATEQANLEILGETYPNVVVALNVGAVVDTSFFDKVNAEMDDPDGGQALDAMLLMSQPGQEAGHALVDVLTGAVTPSGKTVDTWTSSYDYYPAAPTFSNNDGKFTPEVYTEGVYVGYRYFDSFYQSIKPADPASVVNYPFGYGLSYTTFNVKTQTIQADMSAVTVKAKVTNIGKVAGKEVVQVYFSAPRTGLDKPYQELAGYAKTDLLPPGASQTLTISFKTTEMSSYDGSKAAYVMDAGDYLIRVGDSSRNTSVAAKVRLGSTVVTEKLSTQFDDQTVKDERVADPSNFYSYPGEAKEVRIATVVPLPTKGFTTANHASSLAQSVPVDGSSGYYPLDGALLSATTAHTTGGGNWEGTGAPYQAKTGETVKQVDAAPDGTTLFDVAKGTVSMEQFVAGLSVEQLANIVVGASPGADITPGVAGTTTARYESLGIPSATLDDGPAGIRIQQTFTHNGQTYYQYATAWPIGTLLAQTWDTGMTRTIGEAVATEMTEFDATIWLAPGMNIHRDPLNGRNFEYFSEDPLVTGLSATSIIEGVQSQPGLGVTIKHFAANQQEKERQRTNSVISERALREIYLKGFEIAVKSAQPMAVMTAYNLLNGTATSGNYDLTEDVLRGEWGYRGIVMTDWGANYNVKQTVYSGNDLIMPGNTPAQIINAAITTTDPTFDLAGLPIYNYVQRTSVGNPIGAHLWKWGTLVAGPGGSKTYSVTVDGTTDLTQIPKSGTCLTDINMQCNALTQPLATWGTVDNAYKWVMEQLDPNHPVDPITIGWLTDQQRAGIKVTVNSRATPGDDTSPVTSYTVTITGEHGLIRLGDLQRSATQVLTTLMHTSEFAQLASIQGVTGIAVQPYTGLFAGKLATYLTTALGPVRAR
jgi:hypothetical protein